MNTTSLRRLTGALVITLLGALTTGCLSGTGPLADGGMSGTGITRGTISGFGSVVSGGVVYDTSNASIVFNGAPGLESQLDTGMVVQLTGSIDANGNTGTADTIVFNYKLVGVVDPDDTDQPPESINAVGQRLNFNSYTTFVNTTGDDLVTGDAVAISGFTDSDDEILVTWIEKLSSVPAVTQLEGTVGGINTTTGRFMIGAQEIDYNTAVLSGFTGSAPQNGDLVRIAGTPSGSVLTATTITAVNAALAVVVDDLARIEDLVTTTPAGSMFTVGATQVNTSAGTTFINGMLSDIDIDTRVQVNGVIDSGGILQADSVRLILPSELTLEAEVTAVDTVAGTLQLFGRTITIDSFTIMTDSSVTAIQSFSINNIAIGNRVIVTAIANGSVITAIKIERIDTLPNNSLSAIEGVVGLPVSDPQFSLAGMQIDTSGLLDLADFSQGPFQITRNGFFSAITPGMIVRVDGVYAAGTFTPDHASIVICCNWLVYTDADGALVGGGNDADFSWDGSLNTDSLSTNVNATLSSATTIYGSTWIAADMRLFGPGSYTFDTGLVENQTTNFGTTNLGGIQQQLTVGPNQVGAHALFHWGSPAATSCGRSLCNTDVVFLWDINGTFTGSSGAGDDLGAKGRVFNLASVDGDNNGVPGISIVAGPFIGISNAYNLNHTPP